MHVCVTDVGWQQITVNMTPYANSSVMLMFLDHGNRLRVKGTAVKGYDTYPQFGPNGRQTSGSADVDGTAESYEADVADDGEPGRGVDRFRLLLNGARVTGLDDHLAGGNIQLHKQQCQ